MKGFGLVMVIALGLLGVFGTMLKRDALSSALLERAAAGTVKSDANGLFKLVGFGGTVKQIGNDVNVTRNYVSVGTITNNTTVPLTLSVTISPDFSLIPASDRVCELGIMIDSQSPRLFMKTTSAPKTVTLTVASGKVLDVKASLLKNKRVAIPTTYAFTAYDAKSKLVLSMAHTVASPRKMNFK